jgi:hypothetical protein
MGYRDFRRRGGNRIAIVVFPLRFPIPVHPGSPYQHLPRGRNCLNACIGCSGVTLDAKCGGLKIRVSVVRFRPWPP